MEESQSFSFSQEGKVAQIVKPEKYSTFNTCFELFLFDLISMHIFSYLRPCESIDLLSTCRCLVSAESPWVVLLNLMKLRDIYDSPFCQKIGLNGHPRIFVVSVFKRIGYSCTCCYCPLDGPNGFFAYTSLCSDCSIKRFQTTNSGYYEGTIRFYVCGNHAITTTGYAFLTYPFWLSRDDAYKSVLTLCSPFELAYRTYEEKIFMQKYAPRNILRPYDDKPFTLRRMIELFESEDAELPVNMDTEDSSSLLETKDWIKYIPQSLMQVYEEQHTKHLNGGDRPNPINAQPLKDLAIVMHSRNAGSAIKYL